MDTNRREDRRHLTAPSTHNIPRNIPVSHPVTLLGWGSHVQTPADTDARPFSRKPRMKEGVVQISPAVLPFIDLRDFSLIKEVSQPKLG